MEPGPFPENCPCGDEAHKNLGEWYRGYKRSSAELNKLSNDKFDQVAVEENIQKLLPQTPISHGYCSRCQKLLDNWPKIIGKVPERVIGVSGYPRAIPYQQPQFDDAMKIEAGYRNGCRLCTLFVQCSISRGHSLELWYRLQKRLACLGQPTTISLSVRDEETYHNLTLTWPGLTNWTWLPADPLYCVKNHDHKLFTMGKDATRIAADEASSPLALAKKWLEICSETHESCISTTNHALPTRLIDVSDVPLRLVQTQTLSIKPRYATLSHVWGTLDFMKLTEDSLDEFMIAIPEEKLTKTFRDAIVITKSLGLQYLWIDALCIVQNSHMDWRRESAFMASVYGGSSITIAATGATDGRQGCLFKSPTFVGKVHIEPTPTEAWDIAPGTFYKSVAQSPLAARAWSVQERLLSPRTLHFSKTELFWECLHTDASEYFPEGTPEFQNMHIFHRERKPLSEIWSTIVRLYTMGKLSVASDKLVAISGIAEQVHRESGDQYLAGLWRRDIELQLLWVQQSAGRRLPKGSEYRAPSWSWASVDEKGFVHYGLTKATAYTYHAHVVSAHTTPLGPSPFGEVTSGTLTLHISSLLAGTIHTIRGEEWNGRRFDCHDFDILSPPSVESTESKTFRVHPDSDENEGKTMYILPILESVGKQGTRMRREVKGLLILPTGEKKGEFTRAGSFGFSDFDERSREIQERFLSLLEGGKVVAEEQCAKVLEEVEFGHERFVITIV